MSAVATWWCIKCGRYHSFLWINSFTNAQNNATHAIRRIFIAPYCWCAERVARCSPKLCAHIFAASYSLWFGWNFQYSRLPQLFVRKHTHVIMAMCCTLCMMHVAKLHDKHKWWLNFPQTYRFIILTNHLILSVNYSDFDKYIIIHIGLRWIISRSRPPPSSGCCSIFARFSLIILSEFPAPDEGIIWYT